MSHKKRPIDPKLYYDLNYKAISTLTTATTHAKPTEELGHDRLKDSKLTDMTSQNMVKRVKLEFSKQEVELNTKAASFVKITPQARARLDKIPNKLGPYECKLCRVVFTSAFELAMHNCPCIFHSEYKCTECDKVFNSPANLGNYYLIKINFLEFSLNLTNV